MPFRFLLPAALLATNLYAGPVQFTDVTAPAGIHFRHENGAFGKKYLPETMGSGVCAIDFDGDGRQDLLFVNGTNWPGRPAAHATAALYRNNGNGTFTDATAASGLAAPVYGLGCAVGDFDNDGRDDIYLAALDGSHLYRNLGGGRFADVTAHARVGGTGFATGAVWFDYDNDGKLDLFVSHYVTWSVATDQNCSLDGTHKSYCTPEAYKGQSGTLFHNLGNGVFEDVTKKAGLSDPTSKSLGVVLLDYDDDGKLDLFVANDTQPNKLYHNNGNGTFTESGFASGISLSDAGRARAGMGADAADFDNSGRPGLVIGNFTNESLSLYRNEGDGLFTDLSANSGIAPPSAKSLTFAAFFFDYDLDGLPDIFALNGHVADDIARVQPSVGYAELPLLFHNQGRGKFADASPQAGAPFRKPVVGRGAAYLDYDLDGDPDLVLTTNGGPASLLRNDGGNRNAALRVRLVGAQSNRDGIGAKLTLVAGQTQQTRMVKSGSSYLSQSELPVTFGLGAGAPSPLALEVSWPSGRKQSVANLKPNTAGPLADAPGRPASAPRRREPPARASIAAISFRVAPSSPTPAYKSSARTG